MKSWQKFFEENDGNNFPQQSLIIFFYRYLKKIKKKKLNILDLGCGTGSTLMLLKKKSFYVDCVDISLTALKKLKKKNKNKNIKTLNKSLNEFLKNSKIKYK